MYKYLGKWANCSGYLKKHKDGVYVECFNANKEVCSPTDEIDSAVAWKLSDDGIPYAEEVKFEGDSVLKTYYRLVNSDRPFKRRIDELKKLLRKLFCRHNYEKIVWYEAYDSKRNERYAMRCV